MPKSKSRLKRSLTLFDATALAIGAIIGAGIFVISGIATGMAGPAVILSIIIAGIVSAFTAVSYILLSSKFDDEGSIYVYAKRAISPFSGFITGWMWVFENIVAGATVSLGLAGYVTVLFPGLPVVWIAVSAVLLLTAINCAGMKQSSIFNAILVLLKISALLLFIIIGFMHLNLSFYTPFMPEGIKGVLNGAALIFFAYIGFGRPTTAAEEIKNPKKTIPRSIMYSLVLSAVIYVLVGIVSVGLIPYRNLATSDSPIADAVEFGIGIGWLKIFISFAAIVATVSVLLTTLIGVSRVSFAMARDGILPKSLTKVHKKFGTPYVGILATGIVTAMLPFFSSLKQAASITNFGSLFVYMMVNLSAIKLLANVKLRAKAKKRNPVYLISAYLGLISCAALMLFLNPDAWITGLAWLLIGGIYYLREIKASKIKH